LTCHPFNFAKTRNTSPRHVGRKVLEFPSNPSTSQCWQISVFLSNHAKLSEVSDHLIEAEGWKTFLLRQPITARGSSRECHCNYLLTFARMHSSCKLRKMDRSLRRLPRSDSSVQPRRLADSKSSRGLALFSFSYGPCRWVAQYNSFLNGPGGFNYEFVQFRTHFGLECALPAVYPGEIHLRSLGSHPVGCKRGHI
jgi:hypothetical protein